MAKLPLHFQKLIALGIDSSANLPDLNDMTDRGKNPLKPWTANKTVGTIKMIQDFNITDEDAFVVKFQELSKIPLEDLTEIVYNHQLKHFGKFKYNKDVIFKYTYCCIVLNSLKGNATEHKFDKWAAKEKILLRKPKKHLDERYHIDRIQVDKFGNSISFISIKPSSFLYNYQQYEDVFAGLQYMTNKFKISWKIYCRRAHFFELITISDLNTPFKTRVINLAMKYR